MRGEFIDVDGVRLYYYAAGTRGVGEPVLLVHGFPTSGHLWRDVVPLLPEGHRVVVVDLLGYGRSDRPNGHDVSIKGHAQRLIGFLDALRIAYAAIVGHDVGGGIAQYLAVHHPTRVSRLALLDSVGFDEWPTREVKLAKATLPLTRFLPTTWIVSVLRGDLERGYSNVEYARHSIDMYIRPFCTPDGRDALVEHLMALDPTETQALASRLKDIVAPTAVIWGAHDPFLAPRVGKRLADAIPDATFDVLPDVRHFIPETAPETVSALLARWLER